MKSFRKVQLSKEQLSHHGLERGGDNLVFNSQHSAASESWNAEARKQHLSQVAKGKRTGKQEAAAAERLSKLR